MNTQNKNTEKLFKIAHKYIKNVSIILPRHFLSVIFSSRIHNINITKTVKNKDNNKEATMYMKDDKNENNYMIFLVLF